MKRFSSTLTTILLVLVTLQCKTSYIQIDCRGVNLAGLSFRLLTAWNIIIHGIWPGIIQYYDNLSVNKSVI
jgi:hypothetical protein